MRPLWLASALAGAFVVTVIVAWPMRSGLAMVRADELGLSSTDVSGTVWAGRLAGATLGPVSLGDVTARVALTSLLRGGPEVSIAAERGPMRARIRRNGADLEARDVVMSLPLAVFGLPGGASGQMSIVNGAAAFEADRCVAASGRVQLDGLSGPGWAAPPLTGPLACRDGVLVADLAGQGQALDLNSSLLVQRDGRWSLALKALSADPLVQAALEAQGFESSAEGQSLSMTGRITR